MEKRHAARPFLVVDNSSRIAGLAAQKVYGNVDATLLGHVRDIRTPAPRHTVLPFVYPLAIEDLARSLPQLRGNDGPSAQSVNQIGVDFHRPGIIGILFRFVKAILFPTTFGPKNGKNVAMAANGSKAFNYECGRRLIIARTALNYSIRAKFVRAVFGEDDPAQFKRDEDNVRKWEVDGILVPPEFVKTLKTLFGVSHDYIFSGDSSTMKPELSIAIQQLELEIPAIQAG